MPAPAERPHEHPSPHRDRVSTPSQLIGLAIGPAAWAAQLEIGYGLSSYACFPQDRALADGHPVLAGEHLGLVLLNLACLAAALFGAWISLRGWRATRAEKEGAEHSLLEVGEGRSRFLAGCGLLTSAGFALAILFDLAPILGAPACWNFGP